MSMETTEDVDARIAKACSQLLHGGSEHSVDEVELARVAIDELLERRYEITQSAVPTA